MHIPTPPYLASLSPSEQKEALATVLLPQVRQLEEDHAGVILDVLLQEDNLVVLELLRQPSLLQQRVFEVQQSLGLRVGLDGVGGVQGWQGISHQVTIRIGRLAKALAASGIFPGSSCYYCAPRVCSLAGHCFNILGVTFPSVRKLQVHRSRRFDQSRNCLALDRITEVAQQAV